MRSVPLKKAYEFAQKIESKLKLEDFNSYVQVIHEEGSVLFFHHATVRKWHQWYLIFPEHHDIHIYHEEEAQVCYFTSRRAIDEIDDEGNVIVEPEDEEEEDSLKVGQKFKINHPHGSYGEITSLRTDGPFKDRNYFYGTYYYGRDVRGEQVTASTGLLQRERIVLVSDEEFFKHIDRKFNA